MAKDKDGFGTKGQARRKGEREIKKIVDKWVKSKEHKDELGKVIDNPALVVTPETMFDFYRSGVLSGLNREEALFAKHYFKELLPFPKYRESRGKDKEKRINDIIHFHEFIEGGNI